MYNRYITCCFDCKDRHVGCHSECETYKKQRKLNDEKLKGYRAKRVLRGYAASKWEEKRDLYRKKKTHFRTINNKD